MKVRVLTDLCTVVGVYEAGRVVDVDEAQAKDLITRGLAVADAPEAAMPKQAPEAAMPKEAAERATKPPAQAR